ncbi:unnamed protein product [Oncorhynchus mykiss]|uniref:Uncharacterized protein n=1 Tax=Oncorhynchus mykiss TaxID=8022 RepID=A0A060YIB4_ONCMY|nr:unnamed protein product [Oncorhynchus mykiss]
MLDTAVYSLVFTDQYSQLSARVQSHNIYGLGEHKMHSLMGMYSIRSTAQGLSAAGTHNLYSHHPYSLCLED